MKKLYIFFIATGFLYAQKVQLKVGTDPTVILSSTVLEIKILTKI
jgi:hypothetical protein